jgi:hypothetical protein
MRMCRKTSRGSYDIYSIGKNVRTQKGRQPFLGHKLDTAAKDSLKEVTKIDKVGEGLLLRLELDEEIHIAVRARCIAPHRAK